MLDISLVPKGFEKMGPQEKKKKEKRRERTGEKGSEGTEWGNT